MLWDGDDFLGPIVSCVSMGQVHGLERKQKRPVIFAVQLFFHIIERAQEATKMMMSNQDDDEHSIVVHIHFIVIKNKTRKRKIRVVFSRVTGTCRLSTLQLHYFCVCVRALPTLWRTTSYSFWGSLTTRFCGSPLQSERDNKNWTTKLTIFCGALNAGKASLLCMINETLTGANLVS